MKDFTCWTEQLSKSTPPKMSSIYYNIASSHPAKIMPIHFPNELQPKLSLISTNEEDIFKLFFEANF